jgi:uncharacterized membrane protein YeaQ/YmgE (transglycosylase-associated protein family)
MRNILTCCKRIPAASQRYALPTVGSLLVLLASLTGGTALGADDPGLVTKTKEAAQETTTAVEKAGRAAADQAGRFWQSIDAARLKNRTPDEIVAWVIMGTLVAGLAGMMTSLKPTGMGKLGRLALGLAGAALGGIAVRVAKLDFGWGPVLIRYEELLVSLIGAVILIVVARIVRSRSKKQVPKS